MSPSRRDTCRYCIGVSRSLGLPSGYLPTQNSFQPADRTAGIVCPALSPAMERFERVHMGA